MSKVSMRRSWCGAALIATAVALAFAASAGAEETIIYFHQDALGSVRLVTGNDGEVLARHDYLPFGEEVPAGQFGRAPDAGYGAVEVAAQHFTGKERDTESGLDYFGARYYSGAMGRFTGPDPILGSSHLVEPSTWNRYAYAINNPLRYNDPAGLWNWATSAGGSYTDDELRQRTVDRSLSGRERRQAKRALGFRATFRSARDAAAAAAASSGNQAAQDAVAAWGTENDGNNVTVETESNSGSTASVMLDPGSDQITATFRIGLHGDRLSAVRYPCSRGPARRGRQCLAHDPLRRLCYRLQSLLSRTARLGR